MIDPPDFDELYQNNTDPWQVATSWYELRKLAIVLACLSRPRYVRAWDPACGTGHLVARLSSLADEVVASDGAGAAVSIARHTCAGCTNIRFAATALPARPPHPGEFDLVVLSEFMYYLPRGRRQSSLAAVMDLAPRGEIVALHWRHRPHDAYLSGEETQAEIVDTLQSAGWRCSVHHIDRHFVLNSLSRIDDEP